MANAVRKHENHPQEFSRLYVDTGAVDGDGNPVYVIGVSASVAPATAGSVLLSAPFSLNATGTVVAAVGGKRIKVYAIILDAAGSTTCNWRDGGSTALEGSMGFQDKGGYVRTVDPPNFIYGTTAGNSLDLVVSSGTASGSVSYWATDAT